MQIMECFGFLMELIYQKESFSYIPQGSQRQGNIKWQKTVKDELTYKPMWQQIKWPYVLPSEIEDQ
jgi:hypothetical protein